MYRICSKLRIETPQLRKQRRSAVFIENFEQVLRIDPVRLLLTFNNQMPV